MIIPPLALLLGALFGFVVRGRGRIVLALAIATPLVALLAFSAQFVPGGAMECTASTSGAEACRSLPAVTGWSQPAFAIAVLLEVLAFAPLVSVRLSNPWPAAGAAVLQAVFQVISFGGFIDWAPALLLTITVAFALAWRPAKTLIQGPS